MDQLALSEEQLASLSDEELLQLHKAMDSHIEALSYSKGDTYLENAHEQQIGFHKAPNRIRLFFGGNRSGKTTGGVNEARWRATGNHPFQQVRAPSKGCIILQDFQTHARDIIMPKIEEWFEPGIIVGTEKNQTHAIAKYLIKNGSTIDVKSHDQAIKVFEGSDYDWAWFDEPPPKAIFDAVWRGLTDREGVAWITGTPIVEPWMHDLCMKADIDDRKGLYWYTYVDIKDNAKNLGEGDEKTGLRRIEEFLDTIDPEEREAREKGKFLHMSGLIFKQWARKDHLINKFPWPHTWDIIISVDPHPRKPWAISFLGLTPSGNVILLTSDLVDDVAEGIAQHILWTKDQITLDREDSKPRIRACYIDNYSNVESMIKKGASGRAVTILDELNHHVTPTIPRFRPAPKNVDDKIAIFKDWLKVKDTKYGKRPMFMAFDIPENKRFIYEIEHYVWSKMRGARKNQYKNQPEKENDDILDTIMQVCLVLGSKKGQDTRNDRPKEHSYLRR